MTRVDRSAVFGESDGAVERIAPGHFGGHLERQHVARYRFALDQCRHKRVLDIACGTGYGSAMIRKAGARSVVGADVSLPALAFGRDRYRLSGVAADGGSLPFPDGAFEIVVSFETLEHVRDPSGFLREIHRVLQPGGRLLLSTPNADLSDGSNPYHLVEFAPEELRIALADAGFRVERSLGQNWRPRARVFQRTWGVRRAAWEFEGLSRPATVVPWCRPVHLIVLADRLD